MHIFCNPLFKEVGNIILGRTRPCSPEESDQEDVSPDADGSSSGFQDETVPLAPAERTQPLSRTTSGPTHDSTLGSKSKFTTGATPRSSLTSCHTSAAASGATTIATAQAAWDVANNTLYYLLFQTTTDDAKSVVIKFELLKLGRPGDGIRAWNALLQEFEERPSQRRRIELIEHFNNLQMGPSEDPESFMQRVTDVRQQLECFGETVSDARVVSFLIYRSPAEYAFLEQLHYFRDEITLDNVVETMQKIWLTEVQSKLAAEASGARPSSGRTASTHLVCGFCGKRGHARASCWSLQRKLDKKKARSSQQRTTRIKR